MEGDCSPDSSGTWLAQSVRRSSRAVLAAQIASQLLSLAVLAILYRQLGVPPYGLIGMVMPLLVLARIVIASGLDVVTVQQAELSAEQVSALFWVNQILGLGMTLATAALAPVVAWFFDEPELIGLTLALSGTSMAFVLGTQHQALLQRRMRLGTLAAIRLGSLGASGLAAIVLALSGVGVWALVAQQYVELLVLAGLAWWAEPWRPQRALRGVGGRRLLGSGGHYLTSNLMSYLVGNVDKILVGRFLGRDALALYSQAFNLAMKPVHVLNTPLSSIMLPVLSRTANGPHYVGLALGFFRFLLLVTLPAGVGLALVAPEAMRVLGGPEWVAAGPILGVLALVVPAQSCYFALAGLMASKGQTRRLSLAWTGGAVVLCGAFSLGLVVGSRGNWPVLGTALGYTLGMLLLVFPPTLLFALRSVGVPWRDWIAQLRPAVPATAAMAMVVLATKWLLETVLAWPASALLLGEVLAGVATYVLWARDALRWYLRQGLQGLLGPTPEPYTAPESLGRTGPLT